MSTLQFHTHKSDFTLQLIGTVLVSIMLLLGLFFLWIIFFWGSIYAWWIQNIRTAFDSSVLMGVFTLWMYGIVFLGIGFFIFFIGYSLYKWLKQAYFRKQNTLIIELNSTQYIFYTFEWVRKVSFEHIENIALSVVPVVRNGRTMERRIYFHIKPWYESYYPDAIEWEIADTSPQTMCLEFPLFAVETHNIVEWVKKYTDMELYLTIKEVSKLSEVALPE